MDNLILPICPNNVLIYAVAGFIGIILILRVVRTPSFLIGYQMIYLAVSIGAFFAFKTISKMDSAPLKSILMGLLAAVVVFFVLNMGRKYQEARLQVWAEENHYKVLNFRGAAFWEGPKAWLRSKNQHAYRITVQDEQGRQRQGWILFGDTWGMTPNKAEWNFDND